MSSDPIGILDSGVGGLSVWQDIVKLLPHESTIYVGDCANCPYGGRITEEVYTLAKRLVGFLASQGVKLIVVACNTVTVSSIDRLRKDFPTIPIIGAVPVVKTAIEKTKNKKIGILSTVTTAKSAYQERLIETFTKGMEVFNRGTNKLVPFVEEGIIDGKEVEAVLREELEPFQAVGIDTLALGCTHFPFLKPVMQNILGKHVLLLDSGAAIARQVQRILTSNHDLSQTEKPTHFFYTTGKKDTFVRVAEKLLKRKHLAIEGLSDLY